jgi:phenylalanyl-tRNA synthetase alpha chain
MIIKDIKKYIQHVKNIKITNKNKLILFKKKFLTKNSQLNQYLKILKNIKDINEKKYIGKYINQLKCEIKNKIKKFSNKDNITNTTQNSILDITIPNNSFKLGSKHPVYIIENKIINILQKIGFILYEEKEIENEWYNFTALNIPKNHPSRELHDTFFLNNKCNKLLRTHTSATQIRYMQKHSPPIRIISSGKVYRNETLSKKSLCMFHQLEGFYVDEKVSIQNLITTIKYILNNIFKNKINIRFRDSYFPFTQPSIEVDITHKVNNHKWIEILGCGMISKKILYHVGIDNKIYSGFAFGIGIERIAQIVYQIQDIRELYKHNINILTQFIDK